MRGALSMAKPVSILTRGGGTDFGAIDWTALMKNVPAMFALTFFGILHVPINVPALGVSAGIDNVDVNRELIAHGVSNALSGFSGSIQNYLVYSNSILFMRAGGDCRLAGIMLAAGTFAVMAAGPAVVGYIPVMVVGALIFLLGIELMKEALVDTWGKLSRLEYFTVCHPTPSPRITPLTDGWKQ